MQDPRLQAEAERRGLEILSAPGEAMQDVVVQTVSTPSAAIERVKSILASK
jgi:hypothetical protein